MTKDEYKNSNNFEEIESTSNLDSFNKDYSSSSNKFIENLIFINTS